MFWQHRHQAKDQRQFAVAIRTEGEPYTALAGLLHPGDLFDRAAVARQAVVA